jgi:hypothetical protein
MSERDPIASPPGSPPLAYEDEEIRVSLCELLDRVLTAGVVLRGDVVVTVADIDLLYIGLQLIVSSTDTARRAGILPPPLHPQERKPID